MDWIIDNFSKDANIGYDSKLNTPIWFDNVSKKLNDILRADNLDIESLNYTREVIVNSINSRDLSPGSIVAYRADEEFFAGTGYSHPISGYKNIIENINITDIQKHLNKIININNIKISIVGDINENEAASFISRSLYNISNKEKVVPIMNKLGYKGDNKVNNIKHDSSQTHISIYIPSVTRKHENFYNILVANYIFGGSGFGSMLMQEIREKNGLAYSVYSYLLSYEDIGILKIGMQTESKNTERALNILKKEIKKFKEFNISNLAIEKAKTGLLKSFESRLDTNKKMLKTLSAVNDYEMYDGYFQKYIAGINAVSKESIMSSLKSDLNFENILITTVGNN